MAMSAQLQEAGTGRATERCAGMRERLLGDPQFPAKVAIELGIGLTMKVTAEWNKRGKNFKQELDLVTANVIMALIADFMLVWLPAPRANLTPSAASSKAPSKVAQFFKNCPDNAFQVQQFLKLTRSSQLVAESRCIASAFQDDTLRQKHNVA